jgi:hypothetical protein
MAWSVPGAGAVTLRDLELIATSVTRLMMSLLTPVGGRSDGRQRSGRGRDGRVGFVQTTDGRAAGLAWCRLEAICGLHPNLSDIQGAKPALQLASAWADPYCDRQPS